MAFVDLLFTIDSELGEADVEALKFLCSELLPSKKLIPLESGQELFQELMQAEYLQEEDDFLLAELLYLIGQHSLLRELNTTKDCVRELLPTRGKISLYRRMLYEISENISTQDLKDIIFLLKLNKKQKENKSFLSLLSHLEKTQVISEENVDVLESILTRISPDMLRIIFRYKKEKALQGKLVTPTESLSMREPDVLPKTPLSIQVEPEWLNDGTNMGSIREHIERVQGTAEKQDDEAGNIDNLIGDLNLIENPATNSEESIYAMNRKHRGYCLIISNLEFMKSQTRQGTEKDADELNKVFTWLGLEVMIFNEQTAADILKCMEEFASKDHRERDCFICCIMTHGESGMIMGIDNESIPINDIINHFTPTNCPTLARKPKLFFIQACQGKNIQNAFAIEEDASVPPSKVKKYIITIPRDADFLIGMSTVDGHYSYRHVKEGTWYIQALCKNLVEMVPRREDILSILTKVNKDVSLKEDSAGKRKQMPQPTYTLLKKLIFPVPSIPFIHQKTVIPTL
ncbi:caspase-10-like [Pelodytes ibericus]